MKKLQETNKPVYFAIFLFVTMFIVTIVAYVGYNITAPVIAENNRQKIRDNIALLFSEEDGFIPNEDLDSNAKYQVKNYTQVDDIYEVLDSEGNVHAVIYDVWALGKGGKIHTLVAVDPYTDTIVGVVYYKHGETPNIGELHTRPEAIEPLIGQQLNTVEVDEIAGASLTWSSIVEIFDKVKEHYNKEEVHIDG